MDLKNRHQDKYYTVYKGGKGLIGGGHEKKARAVNLDGERPFAKGNQNRAYVNPNFISNMVFYGHSNECVDYPHAQEGKHHLKGEGYNLNNYVLYDGFRTDKTTVAPSRRTERTTKTESKARHS